MKHSIALVEAMLEMWCKRPMMIEIIRRAAVLRDDPLPPKIETHDADTLLKPYYKALGVKSMKWKMPAQDWLFFHMPGFNNAMWDDRPTEQCRAIGLRCLRVYGKPPQVARHSVSVREQDKRHDWKTVK